jgi:hypothetical protein
MVGLASSTSDKEKRPASAEALEFQGGPPPSRSSWTGPECPKNATVAVPKRAQVPEDAPSEAGQQEANADQGSKGGNKSDRGTGKSWCCDRRRIKRCDFCLTHEEHLQEIQMVLENRQRDKQLCRSAGVPLSDLRADVCSRRDTQPAQLQSIMGTRFCGKSGTGTRKQQMHRTALMRRAARIAPQVTGSNCRRTSPVLSASCGPFRSRRG